MTIFEKNIVGEYLYNKCKVNIMKILQIERYFRNDVEWKDRASALLEDYYSGKDITEALKTFPNEEDLLQELVEKLKGKSIYKTLKKIVEGKLDENHPDYMKGLFSLGTHICIELSKGRFRYGILLEKVYHRLGELVYDCIGGQHV